MTRAASSYDGLGEGDLAASMTDDEDEEGVHNAEDAFEERSP